MWSKEWEGVLEQVRDFQRLAAPEGELVWFRGHRRACWTLESTVHRYLQPLAAIPGVPPNTLRTFLRDTERTAYQKFRIRAWPLLNAHERSEWGIVFSMRHLGLPSRLLDWTPSFACAVFFAQDGRDPSEDAAVFALRPERLNERTVGEAGIRAVQESLDAPEKPPALAAWHPLRAAANELPPIAVAPPHTNSRLAAQSGGFVFSSDSFRPLEEQIADETLLRKILLPVATHADANDFLSLMNATRFTYFPDLAGLAEDMREQQDRQRAEAITQIKAGL